MLKILLFLTISFSMNQVMASSLALDSNQCQIMANESLQSANATISLDRKFSVVLATLQIHRTMRTITTHGIFGLTQGESYEGCVAANTSLANFLSELSQRDKKNPLHASHCEQITSDAMKTVARLLEFDPENQSVKIQAAEVLEASISYLHISGVIANSEQANDHQVCVASSDQLFTALTDLSGIEQYAKSIGLL
jgi:hypothetical protein